MYLLIAVGGLWVISSDQSSTWLIVMGLQSSKYHGHWPSNFTYCIISHYFEHLDFVLLKMFLEI